MDGVTHEWCIQQSMFGADLGQIWSTLLNMGAQVTTNGVDRTHLSRYLQTCIAAERRLAVSQTGWNENGDEGGMCFVLPDGAVYGQGQQQIAFETRDPTSGRAFEGQGTLQEWKAEVGALCEKNSRMILSVCSALAGPALFPLNEENGGFHIRGPSSIGKTTTLSVAASVFGHHERLQRTWRTTSNGLEAIAARHNDLVLLLDELSQVAPKEAGSTAYMLGNGQGKARATMHGSARSVAQWRLTVLSTGEVSLADHMAVDGIPIKAGQEARFIDVAADAGAGHGLFEDLHGEVGGAQLSQRLKSAALKSYGTAGRAFIEVLADRDRSGDVLEAIKADIIGFEQRYVPSDAASQVRRVGHRFALVAAVGEACIRLEILPWEPGQAIWAANQCFASWMEGRGGSGNLEVDQAIAQVRHHLETCGSVNYQLLTDSGPDETVPFRAQHWGYRRQGTDGRIEFLIHAESFKRIVCSGLDQRAVLIALKSGGYLLRDANGKNQKQIRVQGVPQRFYVISSSLFADPDSEPIPPPTPTQSRTSPLARNYQV
jgi:putative DNA primase/helicase